MAAVDRELSKVVDDMQMDAIREQLDLEGVPYRDDRAIVTSGETTQTISLPDGLCEAQGVTPEETAGETVKVPVVYWKQAGLMLIDVNDA